MLGNMKKWLLFVTDKKKQDSLKILSSKFEYHIDWDNLNIKQKICFTKMDVGNQIS